MDETRKLTAMGYVRCGLPDDWWDSYEKALNVRRRVLSRSTNNQWFYQQRNLIRRFARRLEPDWSVVASMQKAVQWSSWGRLFCFVAMN